MDQWKNQLFFGDNLEVLRRHIPVGSVYLYRPIFFGLVVLNANQFP